MIETIAIPIIVGIVEAIKRAGLSVRFTPLLAIVLGVVFMIYIGENSVENVLDGIIYGLSAAGLYSGVKASIGR